MERDRGRHLQREEYESEELCNAVALRNILVLWRRIRVLSETPQRYVTYVHSLISSFTFIHRRIYDVWNDGMHTVKHSPTYRSRSREITYTFPFIVPSEILDLNRIMHQIIINRVLTNEKKRSKYYVYVIILRVATANRRIRSKWRNKTLIFPIKKKKKCERKL